MDEPDINKDDESHIGVWGHDWSGSDLVEEELENRIERESSFDGKEQQNSQRQQNGGERTSDNPPSSDPEHDTQGHHGGSGRPSQGNPPPDQPTTDTQDEASTNVIDTVTNGADAETSPQPTGGVDDANTQPTIDIDTRDDQHVEKRDKADYSTPGREEDEEISDFIDRVDSNQEYIKITPVRCDLNAETVARELFGLHEYGGGKKLPLDIEKHIGMVEGVSNFEFIIHKPADSNEFDFYIGPGERGEVDCDRLSSTIRAQYPEDYRFDREQFDLSEGFTEVPHMVRFNGVEKKRKDWMTRLVGLEDNDIERSPLANLLETAIQCDSEVVYQVVMEPRQDWSRKASQQKMLLKRNVNSMGGMFFQTAMDAVFGVNKERKSARQRGDTPNQVGGTISDREANGVRPGTSRMAQIDLKDPANTYNVCIRAASTSQSTVKSISDGLNHLSGYFYKVQGDYLGQDEEEFGRMMNHGITYPAAYKSLGRTKSILVTNTEELANFITVPPINELPKASKAGSGGAPKSQSPLTSPNEDIFSKFDNGMAIGEAQTELRDHDSDDDDIPQSTLSQIEEKNEWWDKMNERETIQLGADHLSTHYIRAAGTGHGKTVATLNDALSAHSNLEGPLIIVDPSGGDMCKNYLSCHRTLFGGTDDVEYIQVPEKNGEVPCIPFFDIRPLTEAADLARPIAVQRIIDHYFEVLNYALGQSTVEQAFVANEILTSLLKAMFDEEHGRDHFSIGDFLKVAQDYAKYGSRVAEGGENKMENKARALPRTSDPQLRNMLASHFEKDARQFTNTTDAVLNRIRKLKERDFIWDMMSVDIPDDAWSEHENWYKPDAGAIFDLKEVFNSNKVILIDTGNIQGESSKMFSVLFLSHLWSSAKSLYTPEKENYCANVIIEESAPIARSDVVVENLLPEGRKFGLSLGLIMQYPEQVLGGDPDANQTAYSELLNNVKTKLIGNISIDDDLSESLFHEDLDSEQIKDRISGLVQGEWVCELPSTEFLGDKAEILTMEALPVPPGHSGGEFNVPSDIANIREGSRKRYCVGKDDDYIRGLGDSSPTSESHVESLEAESEETSDVPDELDVDEFVFLQHVADALSDGTDTMYDLSASMKKLPMSDAADSLVDKGYLTAHEMGNRQKYYRVTEDGAEFKKVNPQPRGGGEKGNESFEHRFGVRIAATYYSQLGYDVDMYHNPDAATDADDGGDEEGNLYDIYCLDTKESPDPHRKIIEVETSPEKKGHVVGDFDDISKEYGDGIWVVDVFDDAMKLVGVLVEEGRLSEDIDRGVRTFEELNEQLDSDGMSKIIGMNDLMGMI